MPCVLKDERASKLHTVVRASHVRRNGDHGWPMVRLRAPTYRVRWADLQIRFALDVLACPDRDGRLKLIALGAKASVAGRILDHLGLDSRGQPVARAQAPPELFDPGPDYDRPNPSLRRRTSLALAGNERPRPVV